MTPETKPYVPCCTPIDPATLDHKHHIWENKLFLQDDVRQILHIPLNMGKVIPRMWEKVTAADAAPEDAEFLLLACDPSPWKSELYMTVTKEIPGARMTRLSGELISRVFDGPYSAVPKWIKVMDAELAAQNQKALKYYFYYTLCPKCAKHYQHNYVVAFAQIR